MLPSCKHIPSSFSPLDLPEDFDPDLLDSTSSYLPAPFAYDEESTLLSPDMSMLASSLSDAYGLSSRADQSHLLSSMGKGTTPPLEFHRSDVTAVEPSDAWNLAGARSPPASSDLPPRWVPPPPPGSQEGSRTPSTAASRWEEGCEWGAERPRWGPGGRAARQAHVTGSSHTHPPAVGPELSFGAGTGGEYPGRD